MSDTPRTDSEEESVNMTASENEWRVSDGGWVSSDFARQLERELNSLLDAWGAKGTKEMLKGIPIQGDIIHDLRTEVKRLTIHCEQSDIEFNALMRANLKLRKAIDETLHDHAHLADGDNCTLIKLKKAIT